jgi:hypothetical protein
VQLSGWWLRVRSGLFRRPPETLNEKIRYHMVFDRDPRLTMLADKVAVRDYVAERVGAAHLTELFSVHSDPRVLSVLGSIPRRCAMKAAHGSGATILVDDSVARGGRIPRPRPLFPWDSNVRVHPDDIDPQALERLLTAWLSSDYSRLKAEWAYRQVPRRILVEELLEVDGSPPPDFKFWCIEGEVRFLQGRC